MPRKKCEIFLNFSSTKNWSLSPYTTQLTAQVRTTTHAHHHVRVYLLYSSFFFFFRQKKWKIFSYRTKKEKEAKKICVKFDIEKKLCVVGEIHVTLSLSLSNIFFRQFQLKTREFYESL